MFKFSVSLSLLLCLCLNVFSQTAYWNFDEGSGNIVRSQAPSVGLDFSGRSNGTCYNTTWVNGVSGKALSFNGTSSYVDCGNDPSLDITDNTGNDPRYYDRRDYLTISAWIYVLPTTFTERTTFVKHYNSIVQNGDAYRMMVVESQDGFSDQGLTLHGVGMQTYSQMVSPARYFTPNMWHHICFTWQNNPNNVSGYIDGKGIDIFSPVSYTSSVNKMLVSNYNFRIGNQPKTATSDESNFFKGYIDEVTVWSRVLSYNEVANLYNKHKNSVDILNRKLNPVVRRDIKLSDMYSLDGKKISKNITNGCYVSNKMQIGVIRK